ncbi:glycosyltransferase family 4 protein [Candidatus Pelagibacter communis]|uniref:glycosyltransferase family 4 protein n=1 Tax=Pelagibacter ubique TaxID=198252 RepID=UPI00094C7F18|nr:glycosyltransferase family 4 protein [Candidatus Pelagibacter ubique]
MSSKLKVLQVIPRLGYGGAETGCFDIAHYLFENNCSSFLITNGGPLTKFINKKKVKYIRLPVNSKNPIIMLLNTILISVIVFFYNIDIIHARSRAPAWSCFLASKITRKKFVTTFHGTYNFKSKIKKFYNSVMLRSDLVIAGSNFIFSHIKENYKEYLNNSKKFLVIFRGINIDYFDASTTFTEDEDKLFKSWNLEVEKKTILLPGRITEWKGHEMFIEAMNKINIQLGHKSFKAVILGSDQGRDLYKKKLIRLVEQYRMNDQIKFVDHCENMPLAYKISDLIVSTSIEPEAFGRIAVEAQSMEKPIIASNLGGSKETIVNNKTGILFDAGDSDDLSKKIIEFFNFDKSTIEQMGKEGRKNVSAKFNVEKMCFSTYSEYKKLIN